MRILLFLIICLAQVAYGLDLETAWQRVVASAPSLGAVNSEVSILEAEALQVSLRLNPFFEVASENLDIMPTKNVDPPQTTFSLSQIFELGGKRKARAAYACSLSTVAYWDAQIARENLRLAVVTAFIEVCSAQERLNLAKKRMKLIEQVLKTAQQQVQNGKVSPIFEKKVAIELMSEKIYLSEITSAFEQAKQHLSIMWGCRCPDFDEVEYPFFTFSSHCYDESGFYQTPDYLKAQQVICSTSKQLTLQKANGIPDVTLIAGFRLFHDSTENGWIVGAAMPIPIFDRNQGSVKAARCSMAQAQYELEEVVREGTDQIALVQERLATACEEVRMRQAIFKEAEEAFELTKRGYQNGKFEYLELLEAEKMLFEIQEKYIDVLSEYHLNRAQLARLCGKPL